MAFRKGRDSEARNMTDILSLSQSLLADSGFATWLLRYNSDTVICFEDTSIMGFVGIFSDPTSLLAEWKTFESAMLDRHTSTIRGAGEKSWNIYTVVLTAQSGDPECKRLVRWVEEDLARTRKLAACGISTRADLVNAFLPILALQQQPAIQVDDANQRLIQRVKAISPSVEHAFLNEAITPREVVGLLMGDKS
jgi:hypothetical protein